jgi:trimethylamine--corrinoid protein Co-methyltransferase
MISTGSAVQETPSFRILSRDQMDAIHDASMEILAQTGVRVYSDEAVALLRDAGAFVGDDSVVWIPAHLIDWAVSASPRNVTVYDRNGREAMQLGRRRTYFGPGSDTPNVIDPYSGERRPAILADVGNIARVCDALAHIDFVMCSGIASDKEPAAAELHHFLAMLRNTTKPMVYTALDLTAARRLLEMASIVAGGQDAFRQRPFAIMYIEPVSPLGFAPTVMQKLLFCAENGIPCIFISGMLGGGTGPVTAAGSLALANAESLAGILIAQLKRKGAPCISGGGIIGMDMRTAISSYSSPEFMLTMAALAELAQYYGLPSWGYAGCTDAKGFDEQAAADTANWVMMAALSGSNLVHDVGFVESGMAASFDQLVFANEMIGKCARILGGIHVDQESLAVGVTAEVGPGGQFLGHKHTAKHYQSNWAPELEDRLNYANWEKQGRLAMRDRVNVKVGELLERHRPEPLSPDLDAQLSSLVEAAEVPARLTGLRKPVDQPLSER